MMAAGLGDTDVKISVRITKQILPDILISFIQTLNKISDFGLKDSGNNLVLGPTNNLVEYSLVVPENKLIIWKVYWQKDGGTVHVD